MIIALTGGLATGKSSVLEVFKEEGYHTFKADVLAKDILHNEAKEIVLSNIQGEYLNERGNIDNKKLSDLIFKNKKAREKLNEIIHPLVKEKIINIINIYKKDVIIEIPLLFESKMNNLFDIIINVDSNIEDQINRALIRDNIDKNKALKIIKSQMRRNKRNKLSDYIIRNYNDLEDVLNQTKQLIKKLRRIEV